MKNIDEITCPVCAIDVPLSVKECEFTIQGKKVKSPTFGYECKKCEQDFTTTESDTFSLLLIKFYESASSSNEDYVPSNSKGLSARARNWNLRQRLGVLIASYESLGEHPESENVSKLTDEIMDLVASNSNTDDTSVASHSIEKEREIIASQFFETISNQEMNLAHMLEENKRMKEKIADALHQIHEGKTGNAIQILNHIMLNNEQNVKASVARNAK
jgi:transcriptional regulator NrdR family protein